MWRWRRNGWLRGRARTAPDRSDVPARLNPSSEMKANIRRGSTTTIVWSTLVPASVGKFIYVSRQSKYRKELCVDVLGNMSLNLTGLVQVP